MTRQGTKTPRTGRPLKIHTVVDRAPDGKPITAGEKVIARVRSVWIPWEDAAAEVGISSHTLREWRRHGGVARARIATWKEGDDPISNNERVLAAFIAELEAAEAAIHDAHLAVVTRAAAGGFKKTKVVETVRGGKVVSKVTTVEDALPQWQASAWMLERRRPDTYRQRYELTGADGAPLMSNEERAGAIGGWLEGFLAGSQAQRAQADGDAVADPDVVLGG